MATMTMTTINSIRVKPFSFRIFILPPRVEPRVLWIRRGSDALRPSWTPALRRVPSVVQQSRSHRLPEVEDGQVERDHHHPNHDPDNHHPDRPPHHPQP